MTLYHKPNRSNMMQVLRVTFTIQLYYHLCLKYVLIKLLAYHDVIYIAHVMNNKLFAEIFVF